jgi:hypothetical protein
LLLHVKLDRLDRVRRRDGKVPGFIRLDHGDQRFEMRTGITVGGRLVVEVRLHKCQRRLVVSLIADGANQVSGLAHRCGSTVAALMLSYSDPLRTPAASPAAPPHPKGLTILTPPIDAPLCMSSVKSVEQPLTMAACRISAS